jgi:hypothetical protein
VFRSGRQGCAGATLVAGSAASETTTETVSFAADARSYEVRVVPYDVIDSGYEGKAARAPNAAVLATADLAPAAA